MNPIVDVILHQNRYSVILDRMPDFKYVETEPNWFQAEDNGCLTALKKSGLRGDAFAGREFDINMSDGSTITCKGNFWDYSPKAENIISVGISTLKELKRCHVFCGGHIRAELLHDWLANNEPKTDYYFYDGFPDHEEAKAIMNRWDENRNHIFYAFYSQSQAMKIHCLNKLEKKIEQLETRNKSLSSRVRSADKDMSDLLIYLCKEEDIEDEEDVEDFIDRIHKGAGADVGDHLETIIEALRE